MEGLVDKGRVAEEMEVDTEEASHNEQNEGEMKKPPAIQRKRLKHIPIDLKDEEEDDEYEE